MKRLALVLVTGACGSVSGDKMADAKLADGAKQVDAAPDAASTARCDRTKPFGAPMALPGINGSANDLWGSLTADELTMVFQSDRGGVGTSGGYDIFMTKRPSIDAAFGTAGPVANINTSGDDEDPSITGDGRFLYVDRYAAGTTGWDIWGTQRADTMVDFATPTRIDSLNVTGNKQDDNQFVMADNSAIYLMSDRNGTQELFRAARNSGGTFDTATPTLALPNSAEISVVVTADELTMYFSSDLTPSMGSHDIWMSKRSTKQDGWGMPTNVSELNTTGSDLVTWVSPDGCNIYLSVNVGANGAELYWARKPL